MESMLRDPDRDDRTNWMSCCKQPIHTSCLLQWILHCGWTTTCPACRNVQPLPLLCNRMMVQYLGHHYSEVFRGNPIPLLIHPILAHKALLLFRNIPDPIHNRARIDVMVSNTQRPSCVVLPKCTLCQRRIFDWHKYHFFISPYFAMGSSTQVTTTGSSRPTANVWSSTWTTTDTPTPSSVPAVNAHIPWP